MQFSATVQTSVKVCSLGTIFPHFPTGWKKAESTWFWTWNLVGSSPSEMPYHLQWTSCICEHCQLSHKLPDDGFSFRAALPIVSEETRPCGNQRGQNIAKHLLDEWWCWIGKITLAFLKLINPSKLSSSDCSYLYVRNNLSGIQMVRNARIKVICAN